MTSDGKTILLGEIALCRSGDKGNHANIGVVALTPAGYEFLVRELTPDRIRDHFEHLRPSRVERFELPLAGAMNFVLYDVLQGGASRSLRIDTQGKLLGTSLAELEFKLSSPVDVAGLRGVRDKSDK